MRATRLKTFEGADVVVPNGTLLSEKLINWTLRDRNRRLEVTFSVAEDSDPRQVIEVLREVSLDIPEFPRLPAPVVLFLGQGSNALEFVLQAWTHDIDVWVRTAQRSDAAHTRSTQGGQYQHAPQSVGTGAAVDGTGGGDTTAITPPKSCW